MTYRHVLYRHPAHRDRLHRRHLSRVRSCRHRPPTPFVVVNPCAGPCPSEPVRDSAPRRSPIAQPPSRAARPVHRSSDSWREASRNARSASNTAITHRFAAQPKCGARRGRRRPSPLRSPMAPRLSPDPAHWPRSPSCGDSKLARVLPNPPHARPASLAARDRSGTPPTRSDAHRGPMPTRLVGRRRRRPIGPMTSPTPTPPRLLAPTPSDRVEATVHHPAHPNWLPPRPQPCRPRARRRPSPVRPSRPPFHSEHPPPSPGRPLR